jgi:putative colanic acid biosynthesis acetyltransferase WcaF
MIDLSKFDNRAFSRGAPAWREALWWVARSLLFAPWFPVPSALKVAALRAFGAKVGMGVVIRSRVNITFPWRYECGDHVWIGDEVLILSLDWVRIGNNVCLSQRAFLCTGSHDFRSDHFDLITAPIEIGGGCWIAACAFVGPGAVVPAGTMVRAGEVWKKESGGACPPGAPLPPEA